MPPWARFAPQPPAPLFFAEQRIEYRKEFTTKDTKGTKAHEEEKKGQRMMDNFGLPEERVRLAGEFQARLSPEQVNRWTQYVRPMSIYKELDVLKAEEWALREAISAGHVHQADARKQYLDILSQRRNLDVLLFDVGEQWCKIEMVKQESESAKHQEQRGDAAAWRLLVEKTDDWLKNMGVDPGKSTMLVSSPEKHFMAGWLYGDDLLDAVVERRKADGEKEEEGEENTD